MTDDRMTDDGRDVDETALRGRLEHRMSELQAEYRAGQEMLGELDAKRADLQQTLLRIGGAIQVLGELLEAEPAASEGRR
ncbi:hypothetical protein [Pseudonocardia sp.]|uniref:hypothetical protein n=1 Tax=Pseudonocardia sp. TaxID=60912 RepID=UPI003D1162AB